MHRLCLSLTVAAAVLTASVPARADDKDLRATVEKAVKAHGGADKLNKSLAMTSQMKGKISVMEMTFDFTGEIALQAPDRIKVVVEFEAGGMPFKVVQVFNKDKGWAKLNNDVTDLNKDQLNEGKEEMHAGRVVSQLTPLLDDKEYKLSSLGEVKVNDKPAIGITVSRKDFRDLNVFFDNKTHLVVKVERRVKDEMSGQEVTQEEYHDDFKEVSGLTVAHKLKIKRDGKDFLEAEISDVKFPDKLADDTFAKP